MAEYSLVDTNDKYTLVTQTSGNIIVGQDNKYNILVSGGFGPPGPPGPPGVPGNGTAYYGQASKTTPANVSIVTAGTYEPIAFAVDLDEAFGMSLGASGLSLKNTTSETLLVKVYASADVEASNNKILGLKLAIDGNIIDESECNAATGTASSFAKLVTNWMIQLAPNETVQAYLTNFTNSGTVTINRCRLVASTVGRQGQVGDPGPNVIDSNTSTPLTGVLVAANGTVREALPGEVAQHPPLTIASGETYIVPSNRQVLIAAPIVVEPGGNLEVESGGSLINVSGPREWTAETVSQTEAEAGTATTRRAWTAERVRQVAVQLLVDFDIASLPPAPDDADWDV